MKSKWVLFSSFFSIIPRSSSSPSSSLSSSLLNEPSETCLKGILCFLRLSQVCKKKSYSTWTNHCSCLCRRLDGWLSEWYHFGSVRLGSRHVTSLSYNHRASGWMDGLILWRVSISENNYVFQINYLYKWDCRREKKKKKKTEMKWNRAATWASDDDDDAK